MRLSAAPASALTSATPLLALLVDNATRGDLPGGALGARASVLLKSGAFKAETRKTFVLHAESRGGPRALLLVGMGKAEALTAEDFRRAGAIVAANAAELRVDALVLGGAGGVTLDEDRLQAAGEGLLLASYRYPGKRDDKASVPPKKVAIVSALRGAPAVLAVAQALGEAANLVRELGDLPGNTVTPRYLAKTAQAVSRKGKLRCRVHGKRDLQRMKMGGILAVNQGSAEEPFLIEMEYRGARPKVTLCIVGKGLTFDSGGISLKPAEKMEDMKYDMCGAAATIGLMQALSVLKPAGLRVIGIVGTTDNMPGPHAYKPGDVVKTASGKTIEVINTDAEGRVVLADALHFARKFDPDAIIDMATLTGAIVVALGSETAGLFTKDDGLAKRLIAAGDRTGEKVWRMPTYDAYAEKVKSRVADLKNSSGREAGSCTAAAFLFSFTEGVPHAHLDIAGTAWDGRRRDYHLEGGSGYGVRLLYDAITHWND